MPDPSESSADLDGLKTSLTQQFKLEISKLEELRAQREAERKAEEDRKEAARQAKLDAMLELQVQEAQEKKKRREWWGKFVLGPTGVLSIIIGAIVAYLQATKPEPTEEEKAKEAVKAGDVAEKVEEVDREIEERFEKLEKHDRTTARELVKQKVQISDGFEHVAKKIDAAHPRQADDVETPYTLKALKTRTDKIKKSEAGKKLLDEDEEEDPLVKLAGDDEAK